MRILTLNMNMFNQDYDNDFGKYINTIKPDIAFIQEFRSTCIDKIPKGYNPIKPNTFDKLNGRYHITIAICKGDILDKGKYIDLVYDNRFVKAKIKGHNKSVAGVHLPIPDQPNDEAFNELTKLVKADIICGDFNADIYKSRKSDESRTANYTFVAKELKGSYVNPWELGKKSQNAYYCNFAGKEINTTKNIRTFTGNTHIDYIFAKNKIIQLNKIIIDLRTLAFTDHAAVIADLDFV